MMIIVISMMAFLYGMTWHNQPAFARSVSRDETSNAPPRRLAKDADFK